MFPISLSSKRARLALRFFTYGVMTLATVVLTVLAIFYAMGYRFNQSTLSFEQGGLVQLRSSPSGATVVIDGRQQNVMTPGRVNLPAGVHTIVMQREGYRSWQKSVSLAPGQLLWLNYTRLIPNSVTTTPVRDFATMKGMLISPDRRWMLIQEKPDQPTFTLADASNEDTLVFSTVTLPEAQLTRTNNALGTLTMAEWDLSSRYVLLHHQSPTVNEWLRFDRSRPEETINLTRTFNLNIANAHFAGSNPNVVYASANGELRRLDIAVRNASEPLLLGVKHFTLYGDGTVSYVAEREVTAGNPASRQQYVGLYRGNKETVVATLPSGVPLKVAFSQYDNHSYLAIYDGNASEIRLLRDPADASAKDTTEFVNLHVVKPLNQLMFSNNGRMLTASAEGLITTYDLEIGSTYSSALTFLGQQPTRPLQWLDDFYLWTDANDHLSLVEFDGQNDREITSVSAGYSAGLSASGETLFSIGRNSVTGGYFLQASRLVID